MRKPMFVLGVILLLAISVAWAGGEKGEKGAAAHAAKLQAKLSLTDAQTVQVRTLMEESHSRWAELKASGYDEAGMKAAKKRLKEQYNTRFRTILTQEQFARYEKMNAEYKRNKRAKK